MRSRPLAVAAVGLSLFGGGLTVSGCQADSHHHPAQGRPGRALPHPHRPKTRPDAAEFATPPTAGGVGSPAKRV